MNKNYEETKKRVCHKFMTHPLFVEVELEGIEPSSAQGNHTLSTRLFQPLVFETWQDLDHQPCPYPLRFHTSNEACKSYFRFTCTA